MEQERICTGAMIFILHFWERLLQRAVYGSASTYAACFLFSLLRWGRFYDIILSRCLLIYKGTFIILTCSQSSMGWASGLCHFSVGKRKKRKKQMPVQKKRFCDSGHPGSAIFFIVCPLWGEKNGRRKSVEIVFSRMIRNYFSTCYFLYNAAFIGSTGRRP